MTCIVLDRGQFRGLALRWGSQPIGSAAQRCLRCGSSGPQRSMRLFPQTISTCSVLISLGAGTIVSAQETESAPEPSPEGEQAVVETVNVTAEFLGDSFSPNSVSTAFIELAETVGAGTAVEAAVALPGVAENGQAGIFQVLSVRGVSRQRLLSFVDGIRISSERRAGVSVSFIDPALLGQVEVSRGPASTYYGSGALGGAIQLFSKAYTVFGASLGWESQGDEGYQNLSWGNETFSLGLAHRSADDAETPDGTRLFSRHEQTSGIARARFGSGPLGQDVRFVGSYGDDIGKSALDFPQRITIYPRERHGLLRYQISLGADWRARLWTHTQDLITDASRPSSNQRNVVDSSSMDLGGLFEHRLPVESVRWDGRVGLDYYGRRGVSSEETALTSNGSTMFRSLNDAEVDELGGYAVLNWTAINSEFEVGARVTEGRQHTGDIADVEGVVSETKRSRTAVTGFLGASIPLNERAQLVVNVGRGLRFPSLTEQFFVGTTGRGQVRGNPDLRSETSTNVEMSLRVVGRRFALTGSGYRNRITDYIERVTLSPGVLGFVNVTSGRIVGAELDGFIALGSTANSVSSWRLEGSGHWIEGEANDGSTLADIPANRLRTGLVWSQSRWSSRASLEWRARKDEFGPTERAIPSALVLDAALTYKLNPSIDLSLELQNGTDESYFPAADDRAPLAMGRSIGLSVRWAGGS